MKKLITTIVAFSLVSTSVIFAQEREIIIEKTIDGDYVTEEHHFGGRMGGHRMGRGDFKERNHGRHAGGGVKRLIARADELGLSNEQIKKIKSMALDFKMSRIDLRAAVEKAQLLLKTFMNNKEVSQEKVFKSIDDLAKLKTDGKKSAYIFKKNLLSVLTDEQREMLEETPGMDRKMKKEGKKRKGYREKQKG